MSEEKAFGIKKVFMKKRRETQEGKQKDDRTAPQRKSFRE
jgi:hypothetical protein